MATSLHGRNWSGAPSRRVPRFRTKAPLDVMVLRSGSPDTVPGRAVNLGERGVAAMLAAELVPGERVEVKMGLSASVELRTSATVRYQDRLRCGLEFVAISAEQRSAIREWAKESKAEAETSSPVATPRTSIGAGLGEEPKSKKTGVGGGPPNIPRKSRRKRLWLAAGVVIALVGATFWWRWNRGWEELESGLKNSEPALEKPQVQVPAEVMQKLLVHRVEPIYPPEARQANLEGTIALDIVVGRDGSVLSMRALNGPDVLARAAMDTLRWWKFEPYRVNGKPMVTETTVAVEFKR